MTFDKSLWLNRIKKTGIILMWVLLVSSLLISLAFVNNKFNEITCSRISVSIFPKDEAHFVDRELVIQTISKDSTEKSVLGKKINNLRIPQLEKKLSKIKFVKHAQVYSDMNGVIQINIQQREPVLRVLKDDGSGFYIDKQGLKMPLSSRYTARVPVATGNIFERYDDSDSMNTFIGTELAKIATYVDKDAFWKAQIEQIFVTANSELVLIPKAGSHRILFGTTENMEEKLSNLLVFYKEALSRVGWNTYHTINLKYKNQVVGEKAE